MTINLNDFGWIIKERWSKEKIQEVWKVGITQPVLKKGNKVF